MLRNKTISRIVDLYLLLCVGALAFRWGAGPKLGSWWWWTAPVWAPGSIIGICYLIAVLITWLQRRRKSDVL